MKRAVFLSLLAPPVLGLILLASRAPGALPSGHFAPEIPRTWDSTALAGFILPLPDTSVDVQLPSEAYYYGLPTRTIYKSYPVYHPDYEPEGYLDSLRQLEPVDVFDPAKLVTEEDWIRAGELVFDAPHFLLSLDSPFGVANMAEVGMPMTPGGVFPLARYVVTQQGEVRLGQAACGNCHTRVLDDGTLIKGAQGNFNLDRMRVYTLRMRQLPDSALRALEREHFRAPWINHPSQTQLDTLTARGYIAAHTAIPDGVLLRQGTNHAYPTRIPDLRGIKDHRYLDATGHMRNRGLGDIMRYAAFNENVDLLIRYDHSIMESVRIEKKGADAFNGTFRLFIKDTQREVTVPFTFTPRNRSGTLAGSFTINRLDFGLGKSSLILADDVTVELAVELSRLETP